MGEGYRKSLVAKLKNFFPKEWEEKLQHLIDVGINHLYVSRELNRDKFSKEIYSVNYSLTYSYDGIQGKISLPKMSEKELIQLVDIVREMRVENFFVD